MEKINSNLCQCGCGLYAPFGKAYIPGHYEAAKKLTKYLRAKDIEIYEIRARSRA